MASGILLAILWVFFARAHFLQFKVSGELSLLLLLIAESIAAIFYMIRSDPQTVSANPLDWFFAVVGTFTPLLSRPESWGILPTAGYIMIIGIAIQILALVCLNRSFALVAAKRSIKTKKMYGLVRHPIYASYFITLTGYLLANTSFANAIVYTTSLFFLVIRMHREEKHLAQDLAYRKYMHQVRYRLLPFVY